MATAAVQRESGSSWFRPEDANLLAEIAAGHEQAAAHFVRYYQPKLYARAVAIVHDSDVAKDIVQEVIFSVIKRAGQYSGKGTPDAWLHTVLMNEIRDYLKNIRHKLMLSLTDNDTGAMENGGRTVEDELVAEELFGQVSDAVGRLAPKQRRAMEICVVGYEDHIQMAEEIGITVGASKMNLYRARTNVRKMLKEKGVDLKEYLDLEK